MAIFACTWTVIYELLDLAVRHSEQTKLAAVKTASRNSRAWNSESGFEGGIVDCGGDTGRGCQEQDSSTAKER